MVSKINKRLYEMIVFVGFMDVAISLAVGWHWLAGGCVALLILSTILYVYLLRKKPTKE